MRIRFLHLPALADTARGLQERNEVAQAFEDVARHLAEPDIDEIWQEATVKDRWVIASDLLDEITISPGHLEVKVSGEPRMNVSLWEVVLTGGSSSYGVGEPSVDELGPGWRIRRWSIAGL